MHLFIAAIFSAAGATVSTPSSVPVEPAQAAPVATFPRAASGDRAFNGRFYTVASTLESWAKTETPGGVGVYTPQAGSSEVLLADETGSLFPIEVPEDGSLVLTPYVIIVSHSVREPRAPSGRGHDAACAEAAWSSALATIYNGSAWRGVVTDGCAGQFEADEDDGGCQVSECGESGTSCGADVTLSDGNVATHNGNCDGSSRTKMCDDVLYVH